jgi:succinate dehydrogenase cytochrome b556 subunit
MHDSVPRITPPFELTTPTEKKRMNSASQAPTKARPKYYDTNFLHLPAPGLLSILRRVGGAVMFLVLIPLLLIVLQQTLRSEFGFMQWKTVLAHPLAKLVLMGFVWAYLHHFLAGRAACGLPFSRRHARPGDQRAPRQP